MTESTDQSAAGPVSKIEIIRHIAQTLVERRTVRGLSLEKVNQSIKIRMPYLQAIERGEWDQLPGDVYIQGFIRRYAQYLGIDGDKLIEPYLKLSNSSVGQSLESEPARTGGEVNRIQWVWIVLGGIFLIGFIKVIKQDRTAPIKSSVANKSVAVEPEVKTDTPKNLDQKVPLEKHRVELFSPFPLWLRVSASDKNFEGFIPQGATWTWKGEGLFTIRLGHTKEVQLAFDGSSIPLSDDQKMITLPK